MLGITPTCFGLSCCPLEDGQELRAKLFGAIIIKTTLFNKLALNIA